MHYLLLAICSSALISIVMRLGEGRIRNNISMLAVNYVICLLLGLLYSAGSGSIIVPLDEAGFTLWLGLINGVFYVGTFILFQYNIHRNGVVMSSTFMKLGVLVPTMIAIIAFGERPGILQVIGILLAVAAILIVNGVGAKKTDSDSANVESSDLTASVTDTDNPIKPVEQKVTSIVTAPRALVFLLLVGGSGDAMSKIYEELGRSEFSSQFLLYTFTMALVLCTITALARGQRFTLPDIIYGFFIGVPNYYSARFLLLSLSYVPAVVVYPTYSVGTIVLVGLAGVLVFREKMTSRQWVAIGIILAAMVLLNI